MPDLPSPSFIPYPNSTLFPRETENAFIGVLNVAKDLPEDQNTLRSDIDGAVINDSPLTGGQIANLVGDYLKIAGDFVALESSALVASGNSELGGILDGISTGLSFVGSELKAAGESSPITNTTQTIDVPAVDDGNAASGTAIDTINTAPPAATTSVAQTNTTTPPVSSDNTTAPASTDTGTAGNTGPIAPTQDGTLDPREIFYALNQGDVALSAQTQIQYETGQGDTDLAAQLQTALNQGDVGLIAQTQDTQLQGSQLQTQLERTNPGLDAQIRSQLTGYEASGLTATDPTLTQSGATISGEDSETYNITGNNLSENIGIANTSPVFISGSADSLSLSAATSSFAITDNGQGTAIDLTGFLPSAGAILTLNGFQNDTTGSITLPSQYATASAAVAALQSDGQGGSILPLGNGASLHFVGDASLTPASFMVGHA